MFLFISTLLKIINNQSWIGYAGRFRRKRIEKQL